MSTVMSIINMIQSSLNEKIEIQDNNMSMGQRDWSLVDLDNELNKNLTMKIISLYKQEFIERKEIYSRLHIVTEHIFSEDNMKKVFLRSSCSAFSIICGESK